MTQSKRLAGSRKARPAIKLQRIALKPVIEALEDRTVPSFVGAPTLNVGAGPQGFAMADFNGDGKLDVATVNRFSNNVSILLSNGDGTFQSAGVYAVGTTPGAVVAGDFNGDGKMDLAVANSADNSVSVLLGNGDGSFGAATSYAVGAQPFGLVVGDFNGDGKLDIATANHAANSVSILSGKGDGTFQAAQNVATGAGPLAIVAADFNHDGYTDLATANGDSNSVSLIFGDAGGIFLPHIDISVGDTPFSMTTADLNNDGNTDLIFGMNTSVAVMLSNGNGTFQGVTHTPVASGSYYVSTADFNGDGKLDVIITNYQRDSMSLLLGKGDGTFQTPSSVDAGAIPTAAQIGDFNGDGKADVLIANSPGAQVPGDVRLLLGNGDGTFVTAMNFATGAGPSSALLADVNLDTKLDLITTNGGSNTVSVLLGNGDGTFKPPVNYAAGTGPSAIALGDFNNDGKMDLVVTDAGDGTTPGTTVSVLLGNGNGTYQAPITATVGGTPVGLVIGDFNGDGNLDVATANLSGNSLSILLGKGDGHFQTARTIATGAGSNASAIVLGDLNGDGKLDLAVTNANLNGTNGTVTVYWGLGDGRFQAEGTYSVGVRPSGITAADVNGDGIADLIVADSGGVQGSSAGGAVSVLFGKGNGTFRAAHNFNTNPGTYTVTVADVNGDGKPDLVTSDASADTASVLLGNGIGGFAPAVHFGVGTHPQYIVATDLNGDGGTDLIALNTGTSTLPGQSVSVLMNDQEVASQFQLSTATWSADQTGGSVTIVVTRTGNLGRAANVHYATSDGTATAGEDYLSTSGILYFAPGEITKTFSIPILDDGLVGGPNETVNVTLSLPAGGPTLGNPSTGVLTIRNVHPAKPGVLSFSAAIYQVNESDGVAIITVTRTNGNSGEVTVHYSTGTGSAVAGSNYTPVSGTLTFENGETTKTFSISILDDGIFRGNRALTLRLDHPTGGAGISHASALLKILETDPIQHCKLQFDATSYDVNETAGTATVTVTRTGDSNGTVQVNYVAFDGSAKAGANYGRVRGTLTFGPGELTKTIEIPIFDDHKLTPVEKFHVALFHPVGGATLGPISHTVIDVLENDALVQFSARRYSVNQSDGTVSITITRSGDTSGTASVHYSSGGGTAKAGIDYVPVDADLTFDAGETSKTITITLINSAHPPFQLSEDFFLTLSNPGDATAIGALRKAMVVINNH